jgi:hypothetical protein
VKVAGRVLINKSLRLLKCFSLNEIAMELLERQEKALIAFYVSKGRTLRIKVTPDCPMWVDLLRIDMCGERGPIRLWFSNYRTQANALESHIIFAKAQSDIRQANARIRDEGDFIGLFTLNIATLKTLVPVVERVCELHISPGPLAERDYRRLRAAAQNWIFQNLMPEALLDVFGLKPVTLQNQLSTIAVPLPPLNVGIWRPARETRDGHSLDWNEVESHGMDGGGESASSSCS